MSDDKTNPTAAADADEAVEQAQAIRTRLDQDLSVLESRLPDPATMQAKAKSIGGAVGGALAALAAVVLVLKRRSTQNAQEKEARRQAEALAAALPDAALQLHRKEVTVSGQAGRLGLAVALVALVVAAWSKLSAGSSEGEGEPDIWGPDAT